MNDEGESIEVFTVAERDARELRRQTAVGRALRVVLADEVLEERARLDVEHDVVLAAGLDGVLRAAREEPERAREVAEGLALQRDRVELRGGTGVGLHGAALAVRVGDRDPERAARDVVRPLGTLRVRAARRVAVVLGHAGPYR